MSTPQVEVVVSGAPPREPGGPPVSRLQTGESLTGLTVKIVLLGLVAAIAVWAAFPLVREHAWVALGVEVAVTAAIFYVYLSPRRLPLKYLVPGTLFLVAFQVVPVLYTTSTAFSNFGDGHRGSKADAIVAIQTASVMVQFTLGLLCALALHSDRVRGRKAYRILLVLPYAMPAFAMLLVWRDMFNAAFGLINRLFGLSVDWLGQPWTARFAVILVQLWLGYPYMFLVATGALQAIPRDLTEAASIDGASAWQSFRRVTLPLLLVALTPLLIASFAFNFNNFNAIFLTTEGGPFPADNPSVGATDLLITYTYRLAFGAQGAQYGFAAAISIYIFAIVALISAVSFRRTRSQEEVYA